MAYKARVWLTAQPGEGRVDLGVVEVDPKPVHEERVRLEYEGRPRWGLVDQLDPYDWEKRPGIVPRIHVTLIPASQVGQTKDPSAQKAPGARPLPRDASERQESQSVNATVSSSRTKDASVEIEARFRAAFETTGHGMAIVGVDGRFLDVNDAATKIFGYSEKELHQRDFQSLTHPDDLELDLAHVKRLLNGESRSYEMEKRYIHKDGHIIWARLNVGLIRRADGQPLYFVSQIHDITELKKVEEARKRTDAALIQAQKLAKLGYYRWSKPLQRIVSCNDEYLQILGLPSKSMADNLKGMEPYLHPDDRERIVRAHRDAEAGGKSAALEFRIIGADGTMRHLRDLNEPEPNPGGPTETWFGTVQDITELKQREEELARQHRLTAIGELSGGVAHDFNNLMAVIAGSLELIQDRIKGDEAVAALVQSGLAAVERGAELTQRLLAFSRKQPLTPRRIDLNSLIGELMGILPRVLGATIKVGFEPGAALWPTLVDPGQLQTALINLAVNARDAMPEGGSLTIATSNRPLDQTYTQHAGDLQPGDYVQLSLNDTGEGMPPEVAKRAFEPFFTTKPVGKGTGLGLSMVFGFVKQSGGHVELHSEQGVGTTVRLLLPRASHVETEAEKALHRPASSPVAAGTGVVLLVEDEPAVRETTRRILNDLGYRVIEAPSGPQAIAMLEKGEPADVLFTDVILPQGMNGVEIMRQALRIRPNLKVLFASGYTKDILIHEARLGADVTLLQKPYRKRQLAQALKTLLE